MPRTQVVLYRDDDGSIPFLRWFDQISEEHGIVKERLVPPSAIELALERKRRFERDPARHQHEES